MDGGAGALTFRSVAAGRKVGVVADDSVLEPVVDKDMLPGLVDLEGLGSWRLLLRDRGTAPPAAGPREGARDDAAVVLWVVCARLRGLVGEGSREAKGEGATDEARETEDADVAEVCEVSLEGHESVLGLTVAAELEVDSRDSVGSGFDDGAVCACACACWPAWVTVFWGFAGAVVGIWDRFVEVVMFGDLSMFVLTAGSRLLGGRGRPTTEGMGTVSDHTCQPSQEQCLMSVPKDVILATIAREKDEASCPDRQSGVLSSHAMSQQRCD